MNCRDDAAVERAAVEARERNPEYQVGVWLELYRDAVRVLDSPESALRDDRYAWLLTLDLVCVFRKRLELLAAGNTLYEAQRVVLTAPADREGLYGHLVPKGVG